MIPFKEALAYRMVNRTKVRLVSGVYRYNQRRKNLSKIESYRWVNAKNGKPYCRMSFGD